MTIVLPTEPSKPVTELGKQTILLYGAPKLGKSSFASKAPGALFFECEPGLNHLEVFKVPTYSWEAFLEACKLIAKGDHNFKTIVIDTVDNAFKMCSDYVCAKHGIEYEGDMGHGKGWALVKNEWHRVLTRLASLPYGLILISHAIDKTIETRTGESGLGNAMGTRQKNHIAKDCFQVTPSCLGYRPLTKNDQCRSTNQRSKTERSPPRNHHSKH